MSSTHFLLPSTNRWFGPLLGFLLLLVGLLQPAVAQDVPPRPSPPRLVNDLAGLLQPNEADALERKLVAYNDSTSSQIAVVTVPTLGDNEIADYAQKLYESWGIGQKGENNGILVLVAKQEHTARIQTGYGLEGAIPDALAKRIISNTIVPAFRQQRYYDGLNTATDELIALAKGEYKADPQTTRANNNGGDSSGSGWTFWLIIGLLILFVLLRSRGGGGGGGGFGRRNRGFGGGFVPPIIFGDFSGGRGVFGGGGGGFGGGGGGGFGGFGGGSSGGGGASGSW